MTFKSSIDSWATIDIVWEEVTTSSRERAAPSEQSSPHEAVAPEATEARPEPTGESRE